MYVKKSKQKGATLRYTPKKENSLHNGQTSALHNRKVCVHRNAADQIRSNSPRTEPLCTAVQGSTRLSPHAAEPSALRSDKSDASAFPWQFTMTQGVCAQKRSRSIRSGSPRTEPLCTAVQGSTRLSPHAAEPSALRSDKSDTSASPWQFAMAKSVPGWWRKPMHSHAAATMYGGKDTYAQRRSCGSGGGIYSRPQRNQPSTT